MSNGILQSRQLIIRVLFVGAGLLLIAKLFQLQLLNKSYAERAQDTAVEKFTLYPSRGLIFDRNGALLINNELVFDLLVTYNQVDLKVMDTAFFCKLLHLTNAEFNTRLNKDWADKRFSKRKPFVFMNSISADLFSQFQENLYQFPGFFVQSRSVRSYPQPYAAHVLGFIREVDQKEIDKPESDYELGDYIGGSGLERSYEEVLKGIKGARFVLKDNVGRVVGSYENGTLDSAAVAGEDLFTTLDIELQRYAEDLLRNKVGSVVAIDPKTGGILAFASSPSYDPNKLRISQDRGKYVQEISRDSLKPFFNRAVMAKYPPGSTFKLLVGLIALQEGIVQPDQGVSCPGYYSYGGSSWGCRSHPAPTDMVRAVQFSCNTFFFTTFRRIVDKKSFYDPEFGFDIFVKHLLDCGLGKPLGIDFPNELGGNVPTSAYYNRIYPKDKGSWKSPTIISLGIGQGELLLTNVQMANLAAIFANRGFYHKPHLGNQIGRGVLARPAFEQVKVEVGIDPIHFDPIIEGMTAVVDAGTGRSAAIPGVKVAGKTGTVQNPHGEDHATFLAFAPVDNPTIAIAVYVENSGGGGRFAAPIAGLLMEKYINKSISPEKAFFEKMVLETDLIHKP
ncbi:MAG: penicillin-binding protein 2 [Saprospirales bacterium]|nr:penicillin-binding protein 2 [Saprospirales bacterium]MBK6902764.1 penicillin-binding protein 2 [Saprospirales bacterium]MBK7336887.1 penicillin-binding protein 2 [Saprospirales bacterium]